MGLKKFVRQFPEMPEANVVNVHERIWLTEYDAMVLPLTKKFDFFDATVAAGADPKQASN